MHRKGVAMPLIGPVDPAKVDGEVKQIFEEIKERFAGNVPKLYRIAANNPEYLKALWAWRKAIANQTRLDRLSKELIILTVAVMNNCRACVDVHASIMKKDLGVDRETMLEIFSVIQAATAMTTMNNALGTALETDPAVLDILRDWQ